MKGQAIKGLNKSFRSNPTGQLSHPGKRSVVKNAPSQIPNFGSDGFSENQSKRKAPIQKGQGYV